MFFGFGYLKMILALLTEVVALHMQVTIIHARIPSLQELTKIFFWACWRLFSGFLNTSLYKRSK